MLKVTAYGKLACISGSGTCYRSAGPVNENKPTGRASLGMVKTPGGSPDATFFLVAEPERQWCNCSRESRIGKHAQFSEMCQASG